MGWLFSERWICKGDLVKHLQRSERYGVNKLIASRVVGMHHWYVVETPSGARVIGLDLMQSAFEHSPAWGYKDLDETVCPYAVDCPLTLLKLATETESENARQWRQLVLKHHCNVNELRKKIQSLAPGSRLLYGGNEYRLVQPAVGRKGWVVCRTMDGQHFRMSVRQISEATTAE